MRLLLINHRYFVASGAERYLFNVERVLRRAGHETAVFSIDYDENEPSDWSGYFTSPIGRRDEVYFDEHRRHPATYAKTIARLFYSREVERDLARLIEAFRPDAAYVMLFLRKLSPSILVALRKAGVPIVVRVSDYGFLCAEHHFLRDGKMCTQCLGGRLLPGVVHGCVHGSRAISALDAAATWFHRRRGYFDLVDRFVTTNPFLTKMMVQGGFAPDRLTCIPTFADETIFVPRGAGSADYLLYAGRLDPSKGLETLIDAMAILKRRMGTPPRLRIVGGPQYEEYERALVRRSQKAGLDDCIRFEKPVAVEAVAELVSNAIASVIPSLWFENLPNFYLESISAGVPVIASDLGSLAAAIRDGEDGLLFRPGDPAALAGCIERLLSDAALDARLRRAGPRKAQADYSARRHLQLLTDLFSEVIAAR
ncbi:glycosyl transferase [Novosphingobium endophyticum]|uniref:Glycosyl transferase n=1 Tax=Novosphingobium endophyticum TaxID=1955250 RepID=A0A916X4K4_9SPHN|nr:glycosyltransferase [Novosphingobium endophyticum]GGB89561.1 glycosyl transferase [Novosphingobium endophyticum]